ncbi:hypothetical protein GGR90_002110 [Sphingopyxis italica]|uniref:Uncharacterized protein n=1 Tax=Sphingopyxis italica TaxID=1129133 RepID=A0A7X5XRG7_9SPHN|nr:hypothetical protein [Sphingopyxis italica]NJB89935.1 hypothetical protein [Sphingopyxis italica]
MIDMPAEPPPAHEQVIEQRLAQCGLDIGGVSVRFEDYLQSTEIVIRPTAGATVDHFECIKNAAGYEIVTFEDREMYQAYSDYTAELARPEMLESLKARLQEKGLLEALPERASFENLDAYAKALEAHGGVAPGSVLRVYGDEILFYPPRDGESPAAFVDHYSDLIGIIGYLSVRDGLRFAFIGNEQFSEER